MYFSNFKNVLYDFRVKTDKTPNTDTVMDLTTRVTTRVKTSDFDILCSTYVIQPGETPEIISHKLYGTTDYNWLILYINDIVSYFDEWPMNDQQLREYCIKKYGAEIDAVKHTIKIPENIVMDSSYISSEYGSAFAVNVTNWDYESELNDKKRIINVMYPQYCSTFVEQFMQNLDK